jgi:Helix-turn-helix domain
MVSYPRQARERAMKVEEVILRALSKQITFWEAARILRYTPRHLRRVLQRYQHYGFHGLLDRRRGRPSAKRMPFAIAEQVLGLYRDTYFDFSVRHFHEKLREQHGIPYSYTCIKRLLQGAGLAEKTRQCGPHRRRRERRPMAGMLLHIDASQHRWLGGQQWHDLIVILDDASSEVYYAQLVEQESTLTVLAALREVIEKHGVFCALYCDRATHFWSTPKEGEYVDRQRLTQVGRALRDLNIEMIPAYSPQARGRSERNFGTWQGRLPQELRLRGITTREEANRFLREQYLAEFNGKFRVAAAQPESAFIPLAGQDLERVFSVQHERVVNRDNTVHIANRVLQIEKHRWRGTLAGQRVLVCEHLDGGLSVCYGPHVVGRYPAEPSATRESISAGRKPAPPAGFPPDHDLPLPPQRDNSTSGQIMC